MTPFTLALLWALLFPCISAQVQSQWKTLAAVPTGPLHEHATVALSNTTIAVLGGVTQAGAVLDTLYIYSIPSNTWQKAASLPVTINHANAAAVGGKIYVLGGMTGATWAGTSQCWAYDPTTDRWSAIASMPSSEARGSAVVGVHNKTIWLASGKAGSGGESLTTVSAFDTAAGEWREDIPAAAKTIPEGRDHGGGGIIGDKFYQVGGSLGAISNRKDTVFVLELGDLGKGWVTAKGRMPTPRRGFATGIIGGKIYTFGGE